MLVRYLNEDVQTQCRNHAYPTVCVVDEAQRYRQPVIGGSGVAGQ